MHLSTEAPWRAEYRHELTGFRCGRHDDRVDATAQFLDWFKGAGRAPDIIAFDRMVVERRRRRAAVPAARNPLHS